MRRFGQARVSFDQLQVFEKRTLPLLLLALFTSGVALMLASTLHAIAVGNLLPAGVETFCVDINQAVVTKLADRGSHQALGIVTDVGPFVRHLTEHLVGDGVPGRAGPDG